MAHNKSLSELEKQAQEIMERFDFEKVHAFMVLTNWKWQMPKEEHRVPTLDEIKIHARVYLSKAISEPTDTANVGSGGFTAFKLFWGMRLDFSLETA